MAIDPATATAATAAAMAFGSGLQFAGAHRSNKTNIKLAEKQMQFQADQSNTAYQRAVDDLRKAGLNPILAYASQASTPTGAQARVENELQHASSSALEISRIKREFQALDAQTKLSEAQAMTQSELADLYASEKLTNDLQNRILTMEMPTRQQQTANAQEHAKIDSKLTWFDAALDRAGNLSNIFKVFQKPKDRKVHHEHYRR